ncbi:MAG: DUF4406 domain-containing protein [Bacilli bacterium]
MPKEPLIYLIGPLTPVGRHRLNPVFEYLYNLRAFFEAEAVLTGQGIAVINPAADFLAVMIKPGSLTEQQVRAASIIKLQHCDAVMVLPGWEKSYGSLAEIEEAKDLGLPIFQTINEVVEFAKGEAI